MPSLKSAICAIAKNEGRYIVEWVAYHKAIGFDHIFIYDNESSDNSLALLKPFIAADFVTVLHWPSWNGSNSQRRAYHHFSRYLAENVEWLIFLDVDEFINFKVHDNVSEFLAAYGDVSGVAINWRMFGDSGETAYSQKLLIERFYKASKSDFGANRLVKTFFRTVDLVTPDIHNPKILEGKKTVTSNHDIMPLFPNCMTKDVSHDIAQINHYFVKSREEWAVKRARGKADYPIDSQERIRPDGEFEVYNRNEEIDVSIQRFRNRLLKELDFLPPNK